MTKHLRRIIAALVGMVGIVAARAEYGIAPAGHLVWNGEDYLPIGVRTNADPASLDRVKAAGIEDVIVGVPANGARWEAATTALEQRKMRYLLRLESAAPMAFGYSVEPQGYRIVGIDSPRKITLNLPGVRTVLAVTALKNDGSISQFERIPVEGGLATVNIRSGTPDSERVLLVYPLHESPAQVDYWEEFDRHRDAVLVGLRASANRPGLRGIVNPLGRTQRLAGANSKFVPATDLFRHELATLLERRYRSIETAVRNWNVGNGFLMSSVTAGADTPLTTFYDMACLVPLWSGNRGVRQFYDPRTNRMLRCESTRSRAWDDINDAILEAEARRYQSLVRTIQQVRQVPVLQEFSGWAPQYEMRGSALDGVCLRSSGETRMDVLDGASRPASVNLRAAKATWMVSSDIDLSAAAESKSIVSVAEDHVSLGSRALFFRADDPAQLAEIAKLRAQLNLAQDRPRAIFFPENATEPGAAQQLPGGRWWLPSPSSGNRIDLGPNYFAYRLGSGPESQLYLWTTRPGITRLQFVDPKGLKATTLDGSDPQLKINRNKVDVMLSEVPIILSGTEEIPIPEPALAATLSGFSDLKRVNAELKRDITEEVVTFGQMLKGMERNPGGNFLQMRETYRRMCLLLGNTLWVELENVRRHNFSDAAEVPGCSEGRALILEPKLPEQGKFFCEFPITARKESELELWIAARIPAGRAGDVRVSIGGQQLTIQDRAVSPYGQGFAWYRLGVTRLTTTESRLRLEVDNPVGDEFAFDSLLITPPGFKPRGTRVTDPGENLPPAKPNQG
ncbi:MAG: hypothetical protein SFX74_12430 [Fimbriimonadaceae bacterium]|nr:hypothetical protein [Fimbriimonadaceae bacterium]